MARAGALDLLSRAVAPSTGSIVVWNPLGHNRTDIVHLRLEAPVPSGRVYLKRRDETLVQASFDSGSKTGRGLVEESFRIEPGRHEIQAWLFSTDGSLRLYEVLPVEVPASGAPVLSIEVVDGRTLRATVR